MLVSCCSACYWSLHFVEKRILLVAIEQMTCFCDLTKNTSIIFFWQKQVWVKRIVMNKVIDLLESCIKQIEKEEKSFSQTIVKIMEVSGL